MNVHDEKVLLKILEHIQSIQKYCKGITSEDAFTQNSIKYNFLLSKQNI